MGVRQGAHPRRAREAGGVAARRGRAHAAPRADEPLQRRPPLAASLRDRARDVQHRHRRDGRPGRRSQRLPRLRAAAAPCCVGNPGRVPNPPATDSARPAEPPHALPLPPPSRRWVKLARPTPCPTAIPTILYFGNDWAAENRTSSHHVARWLAKRYSVIYVESPGLRAPKGTGRDLKKLWSKVRLALGGPRSTPEGLKVQTLLQIPLHRFGLVRQANRHLSRHAEAADEAARGRRARSPGSWCRTWPRWPVSSASGCPSTTASTTTPRCPTSTPRPCGRWTTSSRARPTSCSSRRPRCSNASARSTPTRTSARTASTSTTS